jgi:hypothetical protein
MIDKKELSSEVLSTLVQATKKIVAKMDERPEDSEEILLVLMECLSTQLGYVESVAIILGMSHEDVAELRERCLRIGMKEADREHSAQLASEQEEIS